MNGSGLQNERTSLAWRRTALSLVVAAGTMAKVTATQWHGVALVWLLLGVPVGLAVLVRTSTSYRHRRADRAKEPGVAVVLVALSTAAVGALSLCYLVV